MRKKAIIIGTGIGGLSTALRLLKNGYEVDIYEKNEKIGGRVNIIETETFRFDLSASFRPHYKSSKANNLFFVGSSLHPGPGVSLVLNSSKIVTEEILNNF